MSLLQPEEKHAIYRRDGYRCQDCGHIGKPGRQHGDVQVHHIVPKVHTPSNLVTLCWECHRARHNGGSLDDATRTHVSAAEAARMLGVSPTRIHTFIRQGRLPAEQVGRQWIIAKKDVEAFAALHRKPGRPWHREGNGDAQ